MPRILPLSTTGAAALLLLLAACSSTDNGLATSKSEAQLVRNGAADRLPAAAVAGVANSGDRPVPCGDGDPHLAWRSSVVIDLTDADPARFDDLLDSLVADGWVRGWEGDDGIMMANSSTGGAAVLQFKDASTAPAISIEVTGRCVLTEGIESPEVGRLAGL